MDGLREKKETNRFLRKRCLTSVYGIQILRKTKFTEQNDFDQGNH